MKLLVINGPNINFLGIREKGIYGTDNYETLVKMIEDKAKELGVEAEVLQPACLPAAHSMHMTSQSSLRHSS